MNNSTACNDGIRDILKTILVLQKESDIPGNCLDTCDKRSLGDIPSICGYNTRPITMYLCGCCNTRLEMPISKDPAETTLSPVFRIEKLDEDTATFRVLIANAGDPVTYTATDSFFTVDIDCICALKCLGDTFVESV